MEVENKQDEEQLNLQVENGDESHGLGDMIAKEKTAEEDKKTEEEKAKLAADDEAAKADLPTEAEIEKAKALARKVNNGFVWTVGKVFCPSVDIDQIVDREKGEAALLPLALEYGGEIPDWAIALYKKYEPYVGAGVYIGATVISARQVEKAVQAQLQAQAKAEENKALGEEQGAASDGA